MKILIVSLRCPSSQSAVGGAQRYIADLASSPSRDGHHVQIVGANERGKSNIEEIGPIQVRRLARDKRGPRFVLRTFIRDYGADYDLIIENMMSYLSLLPLLGVKSPVISIKHHLAGASVFSGGISLRNIFLWWIENHRIPRTYRRAKMVFPSRRTQLHFKQLVEGYSGSSIVCPPKVNQSPRKADFTGSPRILYLGVLNLVRKRVDHLLEAAKGLLGKMPELEVDIAGDGPDRSTLEKRFGHSRIHFHGRVDESTKWKLMESAWIFVSPSVAEGFGISWVEANSAGLPVLGYDVGLDTVDPSCGSFVTAGDIVGLGEAMRQWLHRDRLCSIRNTAISSAAKYSHMDTKEILQLAND